MDFRVIDTADNGEDGMEIIIDKKPELVITDIRMQDMDGLEMIQKIREKGYNGEIIVISGFGYFEYAQKAIDYNVMKYFLKPVDVEEFAHTINELRCQLNERMGINEKVSRKSPFMESVIKYVDENFQNDIQLSCIAQKFYCSTVNLSKRFKQYTGMNYIDYVTVKRVESAKKLLMETDMNVNEVMYTVGYKDPKHFRKMFKNIAGISPSEFRKLNTEK